MEQEFPKPTQLPPKLFPHDYHILIWKGNVEITNKKTGETQKVKIEV